MFRRRLAVVASLVVGLAAASTSRCPPDQRTRYRRLESACIDACHLITSSQPPSICADPSCSSALRRLQLLPPSCRPPSSPVDTLLVACNTTTSKRHLRAQDITSTTPTITPTPTPPGVPKPASTVDATGVLGTIMFVVFAGLELMLWGLWIRRSRRLDALTPAPRVVGLGVVLPRLSWESTVRTTDDEDDERHGALPTEREWRQVASPRAVPVL